jgi:hypothetical protein
MKSIVLDFSRGIVFALLKMPLLKTKGEFMKTSSSLSLTAFLIASTLIGTGCASTSEKKLDTKLNQQTTAKTSQDLRTEVKDAIEETPGLTNEQRARLTSLRIDTQNKTKALTDESIKLRAVLIDDVFAKKTPDSEVKAIKARLKKIENEKLDLTFTAVDKAYTILGKQAVDNQKLMSEMVNDSRTSRTE